METLALEDAREADAQTPCPECGQIIPERFCTACGEKRVEERDYSLRHFLGEALNVFANFESPLPRSFYALVRRPGLLTAEYLAGRRKRYLKPLQLFVLCNVIFFFAQPLTGFNTLTTPLRVHLTGMPYKQSARRMVSEVLERRQVTFEEYAERFDATIQNQAKTLVILMVPMFAAALLPLYWRRRRFFVEHLVFATHFYSAFLLFLLVLNFLTASTFRAAYRFGVLWSVNFDLLVTSIFLVACGAYIFAAQRRVYPQGRAATLLKCLALVAAVAVITQTYRFALFFTAFYTT
ncbi:MAG TPA: DUF3667 domain-containing protein [Pyrinomonadaceae bacterium]|nr:DUF3667 domain-containing protein [Pyrinomonadaceae bacterium]